MCRAAPALIAFVAAILLAPPATAGAYDPASQPPFGGEPVPPLEAPARPDRPPPGFELSAAEAVHAADHSETVREERLESRAMSPRAFTRGPGRWEVKYFVEEGADRIEVAQVHVDDATGEVLEAWRDHQVETKLARGYDGAVGRAINSPWIWIPLCVLFVAPFFDPRRPLRLLHLDLLAIVALSISLLFFNRGEITASVPLTYPILGYLFARMLLAGFRGGPAPAGEIPTRGHAGARPPVPLAPTAGTSTASRSTSGPLVPFVPLKLLAVAGVALAIGRIALNVVDSSVIDIGVAGVVGADLIAAGQPLYEGVFAPGIDLRGDVYGPLNYLLYVPFEALFPWHGIWGDVPAAHAAAIVFDLACALALLALGRRLRPGADGGGLGIALAFAWLACPWTAYALNANTNDALIALTVVSALLALTARAVGLPSSPEAGANAPPDIEANSHRPRSAAPWVGHVLSAGALAIGTAIKFAPAALVPLFAAGTGDRRLRSTVLFALAFAVVAAVAFLPFLPDGGLGELYDRTFGYQASRGSPFSVWGLAPSLEPLQTAARVLAVALGVAVFFIPRRRTVVQIAALGAAVVIAAQVAGIHWFYFYVLWFLPLVLVASFGEAERVSRRSSSPAPRASAS